MQVCSCTKLLGMLSQSAPIARIVGVFYGIVRNECYLKICSTSVTFIQGRWLSVEASRDVSFKTIVYNFYQQARNHFNNPGLKPKEKWSYIDEKQVKKWQLTLNLAWPEFAVQTSGLRKADAEVQAYSNVVCHLQALNLLTDKFKPQLVSSKEQRNNKKSGVTAYPLNLSDSIIEDIEKCFHEQTTDQNLLHSHDEQLNHHIKHKPVVNVISGQMYRALEDQVLEYQNKTLLDKLNKRRQSSSSLMKAVKKTQESLPSFKFKKEILDLIDNNRVIVLSGETGCGKTTQVPQYILDDFIEKGNGAKCNIVVTQPRRVSAISVADRVADERHEEVGLNIGYKVHLNSKVPVECGGRILFCTTGILLQLLKRNPLLRGVSHVIIDEAHERDVCIDFLMTFLRDVLNLNPRLRLIVMSASINEQKLSQYFDNCPCLYIPGMTYPITDCFLDDIELFLSRPKRIDKKDGESISDAKKVDCGLVVDLISWIDTNRPRGAILCFFPGWQEIQTVKKILEEKCNQSDRLIIHTVHSKVSSDRQSQMFRNPPEGYRKVILATNIAETSITINDVVYVIDSGLVKETTFNPNRKGMALELRWISKASMKQRRGRSGRVQPGECYHLYSERLAKTFDAYPKPEIQRMSLENVVLDSKIYCPHHKAEKFLSLVPDPPTEKVIDKAVKDLQERGFLTDNEELTSLGYLVTNFSLHPYLGKAMVFSLWSRCLEPMQTIVGYLNAEKPIFFETLTQRLKTLEIKKRFEFESSSDHVTIVNIISSWIREEEFGSAHEFIRDNMIRSTNMKFILDTRKQLQNETFNLLQLHSQESIQKFNLYKADPMIFVTALSAGFAPNYLRQNEKSKRLGYIEVEGGNAMVSKDSVCSSSNQTQSWLTYFNALRLAESGNAIVDDVSAISPLSVVLFGAKQINIDDVMPNTCLNLAKDSFKDPVILTVGNNRRMSFICERKVASSIVKLRDLIQLSFERFVYKLAHFPKSNDVATEWEDRQLVELMLRSLNDSSEADYKLTKECHAVDQTKAVDMNSVR